MIISLISSILKVLNELLLLMEMLESLNVLIVGRVGIGFWINRDLDLMHIHGKYCCLQFSIEDITILFLELIFAS